MPEFPLQYKSGPGSQYKNKFLEYTQATRYRKRMTMKDVLRYKKMKFTRIPPAI